MAKKPILYCKCKLCGSTYNDIFPSDRETLDGKHIAKYEMTIASTHDCSKGENPIPDAYGVGEIIGVVYQ